VSFILDALRKSEHARERRALPGLVDLPVSSATPAKLPLLLAGLGALLVVNVVVLSMVLLKPAAPPAPTVAAAARPVAPEPPPAAPRPDAPQHAAAPDPAATAPPPRTRPLDTEAGREPAAYDAEPPALPGPDPSLTPTAPPGLAAIRAAPAGRVTVGGVPTLNDLPAQLTAGLPRLNLDLHVYSGEPAQRFVMLNGQRLHEGGQLREGPTLERITPDGAILSYRGTRFLLPRE
jgi:general secretion pathway protein B